VNKQIGRTLIELMIAIAISVVIVLGISALYSASTRSTRAATQLGAMNEDGALSLHLIGQSIKRAGYGEIVGTDFVPNDQTLFAFANIRACKNGRFVSPGTNNFACTTVANSPDSLSIQFQGESIASAAQRSTLNCLGGNPVMTQIVEKDHPAYLTQVPLVRNVYEIVSGNLACSGNAQPFQSMAGNIEEFKIYFGYDDKAADDSLLGKTNISPGAANIVDADYIRTKDLSFAGRENTAWDYIVSVHICAVARTREKGTAAAGNTPYEGCPQDATQALGNGPIRTPTDAAIRKQYRQVFTVRSQATSSPSVRIK
jgi:Type IV Pilus-assembly protein W/Prokaryotic N-terminal methylation motif